MAIFKRSSLILIVIVVTALVTSIIDNKKFLNEMQPFITLEAQKCELEKQLSQSHKSIELLKQLVVRQRQILTLVQVPSRVELVQKPNTKVAVVSVPPDFSKFDIYENRIVFDPTPHFEKVKIDKKRWHQVWNCRCPITCDCWLGKPCKNPTCPSSH